MNISVRSSYLVLLCISNPKPSPIIDSSKCHQQIRWDSSDHSLAWTSQMPLDPQPRSPKTRTSKRQASKVASNRYTQPNHPTASNANIYPTDLPIHRDQKILHRLHRRPRRFTPRRPQKAQQTMSRLPTLLAKPRRLGSGNPGEG
jgi:hypothetical protein